MEDTSYYIYKLEIGDYFYFGSSKTDRLKKHKYNTYTEKREQKLYKKIRELCPNPKYFYNFIDFSIYHNNLNKNISKYLENMYLQNHKDNPYSLNSNIYIFKKGETQKDYEKNKYYNSKTIKCKCCNSKSMKEKNYKKHLKTLKHQYNELMYID